MAMTDPERLAAQVCTGDRRALARAITLAESTRPDHEAAAAALLDAIGDAGRDALRLGLSGTPGVGKSTFIEALGLRLADAGRKVAVLAVDPSSRRTGGSILGDKTRMPGLSRHPNAYIRPSPSQTELGGVARRTRESIRLVEAAGFDVVMVETVGVGQSEVQVAGMTDVFLLLMAPAGGDELQGVKRGIMEIADILAVNKADGDLAAAAARTAADYAGAMRLIRKRPGDPEAYPVTLTCSAATGTGLDVVWDAVCTLDQHRRTTGERDAARARQSIAWLHSAVERGVLTAFAMDPRVAARRAKLEAAVASGARTPDRAAAELLRLWRGHHDP